jgi:hypothetical protein
MDDVKVHYNSSKPAQLNAHAYAQGNQIHLAPGQQKHLPHEAWQVVQQKQGRVKPTTQLKGKVNINDDAGLEKEADVMGAKAVQLVAFDNISTRSFNTNSRKGVVQRVISHGYHPDGHEIVSFEADDQRPDVEGKVVGDDEHLYEPHEVASAAGGGEKYLKKKIAPRAEEKKTGVSEKEVVPKKEDTAEEGKLFITASDEFKNTLMAFMSSVGKKGVVSEGVLNELKALIVKSANEGKAVMSRRDEVHTKAEVFELIAILKHLQDSLKIGLKSIIEQDNLDGHLSEMGRDEFAEHASQRSAPHPDSDLKGVMITNLFSGALPSATISIIGNYYSSHFRISDTIEKESQTDILDKLVADEEREITEDEAKSSKPADRQFYRKPDEDKDKARLALQAALLKEATYLASRRGVTPKVGGKMRSWHLNDTGKLPRLILKGRRDALHISKGFSGLRKPDDRHFQTPAQVALHKQWLQDLEVDAGFQPGYIKDFSGGMDGFRKEAAKTEPGYIEINPEGWKEAESQGRLLYDYIEDRWFLTSDHYNKFFWEIIVPQKFKLEHLKVTARGYSAAGPAKAVKEERPERKEDFELHDVNNCLLDALATAAGRAIAPDLVRTIREDLQRRHLGNVGEMLFADQTVVEAILGHLGMAGTPVVLFQAGGHAQEVGGGDGGLILNIYHTGALHYTGRPTTAAQTESSAKGKSEDPSKR